MNDLTNHLTRRQLLGTAISGAAVFWNEKRLLAADADPRVRGPFPILSTPFTETGAVDFEVLAEASRSFKTSALCVGVQGRDTEEMLVYA